MVFKGAGDLLHVLYFCYFICILIIYIADHWFIPAVPLCSADWFFIRINEDIIIIIIIIIIILITINYNGIQK